MSIPPLVEVSWIDSFAINGDWNSIGNDIDKRVLFSSGYLVSEDEDYLVLANTWDSDAQTYGDGVAVLKRCVLSKHMVREC